MPPRIGRWGRRLALGGVVGMIVVLGATEVRAEPLLGLGTWEGALEAGFDWDRLRTTTQVSSETKSAITRYTERLTIRNNGAFILDPGLWTSSVSGTVGLFQEQDRFDGSGSSRNGTLLGYSLDTVILGDKPYTGTIFTRRNQSILAREFGGRTDLTLETRGGTFSLREDSVLQDLDVHHFSSLLGARQERTTEDTTVLGQTFRRDEVRTILSFDGHKGFTTSDLDLRYEFTDSSDQANPLSNFQSHSSSLVYSLDFGPTLNRRWDSRLSYFTRTGLGRNTFLSADEELRIDHDETLSTDYRYFLTRLETATGVATSHTGTFRGQHRLYQNLTTTLTGLGSLQDLQGGERMTYTGLLDLSYQRSIPWNGRLLAGAGARYQVDDNRLAVSRIEVVDEPHVAPSPIGGGTGFALNNLLVVVSTIVVVDTRGGARLPTTLGVDYIAVAVGDSTQIIPLASSPVILPGDPLVVSYAFEVSPKLKFSTVAWRATAGVDFGWITASFAHEQSDQTRLSGQDGHLLEDRRTEMVRLDTRAELERLRALASAQVQIHDSTRLKFTNYLLLQSVSYRAPYDVVLRLQADESFTRFTLPRRDSSSVSARAEVDWVPVAGLFITGFVGFRRFLDSQLPTEKVRETGVRARWSFGKLDVAPTFSWTTRERGSTETTDMRVDIRAIRRF